MRRVLRPDGSLMVYEPLFGEHYNRPMVAVIW
jgi:hypothetical protein